MYCPSHFLEERSEVLLQLIEQFPLATVVAQTFDGLVADHIPVFFESTPDGAGKLIGHAAKSNPLWQTPPDQEVLLVFQGPSTYVSPNWYPTKQDGGKVVPTWNYAVVHVGATLRPIHEPAEILSILTKLTSRHEATQPHPWQVADAPSEFTRKLLGQIVGLEFAIKRMHGKWKVSQNMPIQNQQGVITGLQAQRDEASLAMASLVQAFGKT